MSDLDNMRTSSPDFNCNISNQQSASSVEIERILCNERLINLQVYWLRKKAVPKALWMCFYTAAHSSECVSSLDHVLCLLLKKNPLNNFSVCIFLSSHSVAKLVKTGEEFFGWWKYNENRLISVRSKAKRKWNLENYHKSKQNLN